MNIAGQHNIGAFVAVATSVEPQAASAGTINGASIDRAARTNPLSCVMHTIVGADAGSPSAVSVQSQLQHSPDNSTWTNYTDPSTNLSAQAAALSAINTENSLAVDLGNAYRYIRVQTVVSFTGGTSPTALIAADLVLGGEDTLPAT